MKYFFILLIYLCSCSAPVKAEPFTEVDEFSHWLFIDDFEKLISSIPSNKFPAIVQGGSLLGDAVNFRALVVEKPDENFQYRISYGKSEKEFKKLNNQYIEMGFVLTYQQKILLMEGFSYQTVWVKNAL